MPWGGSIAIKQPLCDMKFVVLSSLSHRAPASHSKAASRPTTIAPVVSMGSDVVDIAEPVDAGVAPASLGTCPHISVLTAIACISASTAREEVAKREKQKAAEREKGLAGAKWHQKLKAWATTTAGSGSSD
jgi:hypothetical protein